MPALALLPSPASAPVSFALVAAGGAVGAVLRYALSLLAVWGGLPPTVGTLAANITGCFAAGALLGAAPALAEPCDPYRLLLLVGVMGGLSTFSALSVETVALVREGRADLAALNMLGNVAIGLLSVWGGLAAGKALSPA